MVRVLKLLLLSITCVAGFADNLTYLRIDRLVIEKRIQTVLATDRDRASTILAQFKAAGCPSDQLQEQAVPGEELLEP